MLNKLAKSIKGLFLKKIVLVPSPLRYKFLTVLLFHNDEDIIEDQIEYYKNQNKQDIIIFTHNSTDDTNKIIDKHKDKFLCIYYLNSNFLFKNNDVHKFIYQVLRNNYYKYRKKLKHVIISNKKYLKYNYSKNYDWISFPESDEFLEGDNREKKYYEHLLELPKNINKVQFLNIVFWFTEKDDTTIKSPVQRIKYYCYKEKSAPRIYAWRGKKTIIRPFGHRIKKDKDKEIIKYKTRHYEIRSLEHLKKKALDRKHISIGVINHHYKIMYDNINNDNYGKIKAEELHLDDGKELNMKEKFDWKNIY